MINKLIFIFIITLSLASCRSKKDLTKSNIEESVREKVNTTVTQTVTEKFDEPVETPEVTVTDDVSTDDLLCGDSSFVETPEIKVVTKIDPRTKKVKTVATVKSQTVNVPGTRTTTTSFNQNLEKSVDTKSVTSELHKETKANFSFNWIWLLIAILIVFALWKFGLLKRSKKEDNTV